ncbi:DUF4367 domain-containing protein [Bacillus sp. SCS-153A]|uniref:DUF4367 domain-containing protein n=1 Tax=Rossellomorea sedimentorum TaxID=3115294 RepID=UPI003905A48D
MKKILFLLLLNVLLLAACGSVNSSLKNFDNTELKKEMEELAFQPKLPTKTPFEVTETDFRHPPSSDDIIMVDFMSFGDSNNHMSLMVVNGKNVESSNMDFEDVEVGDTTGKYAVNDADAMILKWTEDGISYDLTFFGKQSEKEVTKEELIETAESFE